MPDSKPLKVVFGAGNWGTEGALTVTVSDVKTAQALLDIVRKHNLDNLDTSRNYPRGAPGSSEALIGQTDASSWMTFDTKVFSETGDHKAARIAESVDGSLEALKTNKLHIEYLHWPDRSVPLEETLGAMDKAYRQGKFEKFGLSNYSVQEIQKIVEICDKKGWVRPTVYQGHYNVLCRRGETQLLPILRKHGIALYAWSPGAGGALGNTGTRMKTKDEVGDLYRSWYGADVTTKAVQKVAKTAEEKYGIINGHEVALRWIMHHSALKADLGDAIVIGSAKPAQLDEALTICKKGPLPAELVRMIDELWNVAESTAPGYSPWVDAEGKFIEMDNDLVKSGLDKTE